MDHVRLLYPLEKTEAAARLADAIAAAGYRVERQALSDGRAFPDVAAEAGKAKALILIWSRGFVSAAMEGTRLASARRSPNLIEVSADGIEPAGGAESSPVILLCGWRGQPYHQGWQRILSEIGRLCGATDEAAKRRRAAPSAVAAPGVPSASAPGRRPVRAAVAAGALIAAVAGFGALYERGGSDPGRKAEARPAIAALSDAPPAPDTDAALQPPPQAPATLQGPEAAAAEARPGPALAAASEPAGARTAEPAPEPTAGRTLRPRPAAISQRRNPPARLAAASGGEVKRYSRKHSKTMRLFCQRSGRSTPQCRTFVRSMRDG